ncbi:MAG: thermonuclease family protein, partial [Boseongicola sp. SB0673_bin_14]|nr:thermonuclease family protein [Boseongicola sp. SB0673_bin_14]
MTRNPATITALAAVALLTACGGGGGDPEPPATDPPPPATVVRVIDADTVDVDGTRFRLHGIDAPETRQTCRAMGRTWNCGAAATEALRARAEGMSCSGGETDRYGRTIGTCSAGGTDLNAWLVANGWALAYLQYSGDYADEEAQARAARLGIHRGRFVDPWDWRRGERLDGTDTFAAVTTSGTLDAAALADRLLAGNAMFVHGRWMEHGMFAMTDGIGGQAGRVAVSFGSSFGTVPSWSGGA